MRPRWQIWWRLSAVGFDVVAVSLALVAVAAIRFGLPILPDSLQPSLDNRYLTTPLTLAVPVWVGAFALRRLYSPLLCRNAVEEARRVVTGGMTGAAGMVLVGFFLKQAPSRLWLAFGTPAAIMAAGAGRRGLRALTIRLRKRGLWSTPVAVVGRHEAKRVLEHFVDDASSGLVPVVTCGFVWNGLPSTGVTDVAAAVRDHGAGAIVVVNEDLDRSEVRSVVAVADQTPVKLFVVPGLDYMLVHNLHVVPLGAEPALALEPPSLRGHQKVLKRGLDLVLAPLGLVLAAPLMAAIALAVRMDSPGPAVFRQMRTGRGGRPFRMLKFRTMVHGADAMKDDLRASNETDGVLFKMSDDPRLTRLGRFLRRYSLDELPQLWNVIRGDMSLVGPRPMPVDDYAHEGAETALLRRLHVRPGITGLWQVSGRSGVDFEGLVRMDLTYVQNWSVLIDVYILLRTVPEVMWGRGAR